MIRCRAPTLIDPGQQVDVLLESLRQKCGDAEFGYRIQALFAHTIMRQGWSILAINAKGHPDIRAQAPDDEVLIQVKSHSHRSADASVELSHDDVEGIRAIGRRTGWFALLDCAIPVQWVLITGDRAVSLLGRPMHLATLQANCNLEMSESCNKHFYDIVLDNHVRLPTLSFQVLCHRALSNNGL